jgi:NTE family protein
VKTVLAWPAMAGLLLACAPAAPTPLPAATLGQVATATSIPQPPKTALVLGGGGPVPVAWETGFLKGLRDGGVDPAQADVTVATSGGSRLGTKLLSGRSLDGLYESLLAGTNPAPQPPDPFDAGYAQQTQDPVRTASELTQELRKQVGQRALVATAVVSEEAWMRTITSDLGDIHSWPGRTVRIPAGDVADGTIRFFDSTQGVPIERAVAASNALPGQIAPVTIGDRRYMDGFVGGPNVDGAAGAKAILVLIPVATGGNQKVIQPQVEAVKAGGSRVLVLSPDEEARGQMTLNAQDLSKLAAAAQAGFRQGAAAAPEVHDLWK